MTLPTDPIPSALAAAREARVQQWFEFLCKTYVQRADERQVEMGLQYTTAETHNLAKVCAAFAAAHIEALAQRCAELEKALKPFGDFDGTGWHDDDIISSQMGARFTVGDCRRARRASAPGEKDKTP